MSYIYYADSEAINIDNINNRVINLDSVNNVESREDIFDTYIEYDIAF